MDTQVFRELLAVLRVHSGRGQHLRKGPVEGLTFEQAAERWGTSAQTLRRYMRGGVIDPRIAHIVRLEAGVTARLADVTQTPSKDRAA